MKINLLIIEDDEDMATLFKMNLGKDYHVVCETNGANAIKTASLENPKVVLLDLHMPNVDGYEVLMQFRNHPATSNLPVICTSADTSDSARDRAYALGAIGFIKKPPNLKQLSSDIKSFLSSINPRLESFDKKHQFTIAFNDDEKTFLMKKTILDFRESAKKTIMLSWKDGKDFFKDQDLSSIEDESLIFLKIKPTLITKFPYMQDLGPIINDIKSFLKGEMLEFNLIIDEPLLLFGQQETSNATAKIFSFTELLSKNFETIACFSSKQRDPQRNSFLMGIAKAFVGNTN